MSEASGGMPSVAEDALSALLDSIRLRGQHVFRGELAAGATADQLAMPLLHIVHEGSADVDGAVGPMRISRGDLLLLPGGAKHRFVARESCRWLTGTIAYEPTGAAARLMASLPSAILLSFGQDDPREWLEVSSRLLLQEVIDPLPGASVMVSRIVDLLFVQTLRAWAREAAEGPGWLTAAMDPQLGRVMTALHRDPGAPWTVAGLAEVAHLSRSAFAQRFAAAVGMTPMHYLAERRFDLAVELLAGSDLPVHRIAVTCGYASEAAFSRAFSRRHGASPLQWRRARRMETIRP